MEKDEVITGNIDYYALTNPNNGLLFKISLSQGGTALTGSALTTAVSRIDGVTIAGTDNITYPWYVQKNDTIPGRINYYALSPTDTGRISNFT